MLEGCVLLLQVLGRLGVEVLDGRCLRRHASPASSLRLLHPVPLLVDHPLALMVSCQIRGFIRSKIPLVVLLYLPSRRRVLYRRELHRIGYGRPQVHAAHSLGASLLHHKVVKLHEMYRTTPYHGIHVQGQATRLHELLESTEEVFRIAGALRGLLRHGSRSDRHGVVDRMVRRIRRMRRRVVRPGLLSSPKRRIARLCLPDVLWQPHLVLKLRMSELLRDVWRHNRMRALLLGGWRHVRMTGHRRVGRPQ